MKSGILEIFASINFSLQLFGAILIGFKIVFGSAFIVFYPNLQALIYQEIIGIILHPIIIITAILASKLALKDARRKHVSLILLIVSQILIVIVAGINIAGIIVYKSNTNPFIHKCLILNIVAIAYLAFLFVSQTILMILLLVVMRARRGGQRLLEEDD